MRLRFNETAATVTPDTMPRQLSASGFSTVSRPLNQMSTSAASGPEQCTVLQVVDQHDRVRNFRNMHHPHAAKLAHAMPVQLASQGSILLASQGDNLSPQA